MVYPCLTCCMLNLAPHEKYNVEVKGSQYDFSPKKLAFKTKGMEIYNE